MGDTEEGNRDPASPHTCFPICDMGSLDPQPGHRFLFGPKKLGFTLCHKGGDQGSCLSHPIFAALQCPTPDTQVSQEHTRA